MLLIGEIAVYASLPRPETVLEHFELFEENPLAGLLTLDLLGMISYLLFIPTIMALYVALRQTSQAVMATATVLFLVGIADFFATNTAFPVLALSEQYAEATTDAERAVVLGAGQRRVVWVAGPQRPASVSGGSVPRDSGRFQSLWIHRQGKRGRPRLG